MKKQQEQEQPELDETQNFKNNVQCSHKFSDDIQERIDQAYSEFENTVKQWAYEELANELYEIELCLAKIDLCSDLEGVYANLIDFNLKDVIHNFLNGGEFNGELQLEKTIQILQWMVKQNQNTQLTFEDEIFTIDGITIPTQKTIKQYCYDYEKKKVVQYHQFHFFYVTMYNFEPNWIKYLIETRSKQQQISKKFQCEEFANKTRNHIQNNFEFICKQEYFLEKFNYIQK
ncbi:hypothetical protein ABPG72_002121 [Tetrahymena utriculariae]